MNDDDGFPDVADRAVDPRGDAAGLGLPSSAAPTTAGGHDDVTPAVVPDPVRDGFDEAPPSKAPKPSKGEGKGEGKKAKGPAKGKGGTKSKTKNAATSKDVATSTARTGSDPGRPDDTRPGTAPAPPVWTAPGAAAAPGATPRWVLPALAVAALIALAAVVFGVSQRSDASSARSTISKGQAAAVAAGRFSQELFTYDPADPQAQRDALMAMATDDYRQRWDTGQTDSPAGDTVALAGEVLSAKATEVDGDRAEVLTTTRLRYSAATGAMTARSHLLVDLRLIDGEWKVNGVEGLSLLADGDSAIGGSATPPAPGTPTTTAAPSSTTVAP